MRYQYLRALLYQDIGFHDKNKAGDMASRLAEQSTTMVTGMGNKLGATGHHLGTFVGGLAVGFFFSPELTGVILAFFPGFIIAGSLLEMSGSKYEKRIADAYASANAIASEAITSIKTVIAFSRERSEIKRYEDNLHDAQTQGTNRSAMSGLAWGLFNLIMFSAYGVGCWYGAQLIVRDREDDPAKCDPNVILANTGELKFDLDGCVTGGIVLSVFFGVLIGGFSLAQVGPNFAAFASARAAAAKLFDVIDKKPVVDSTGASKGGKVDAATFKGRIELRNATFRYPTRPNEVVLKGVSMIIEPGQQVALVGPSGSGKSTIIGLLQRWYDLESGSLLIDGVDVKEYDPVSLRASMGLILQNPILFDTTVRENVAFGVGGLDKVQGDTVEEACRAANAEGFVLEKEEGFEYQVGVRGNKLSGGQRQRVCIARAVARNPRILLADEATSALDNESEIVVQQSLDKLLAESGGKRTSIVIAHRLSTIRNSNKIFVLDHGSLVEQGSHDELMEQADGLYRKLYMLSQEEGGAHHEAAQQDASDGTAASAVEETLARAPSTGSTSKDPVKSTTVAPLTSESSTAGKAAAADDDFEAQLAETEPRVKSSCFGLCKKLETKEEKEARMKLERYPDVPAWRVFREYQWQDRWVLAAAIFFAAINGTIFPMFALIFTEITITMFQLNADTLKEQALDLLVLFVVLAVVSFIANLGQFFLFGYAGERLTKRLRAATFKAVMRQDATFFDARANTPGRVAARLSADAALVRATTGEAIGIMAQNLVALGVGIGIAFSASWRLTLVLIATIPFMAMSATLETQFFTESGAQGTKGGGFTEAAAVALEAVSAVRTVNAFALQERVLNMFRTAMDASAPEDRQRALFAGFAFGLSQGVQFLIYSLCFYVGTEFIAEGYITFDELFKVFFVVTMAAYGAGQAASMATDSAKAEPAKRSIFALLDAKPGINAVEPTGAVIDGAAAGDLQFDKVTFAYPSAPDKPVLKDFTLTVKHGQTVALVGPSGSGKSTVVAMLQRQYDPQQGCIKVDGADIRTYNPVSYRNQFGFVPQEPTLFQEPISYNVAYGRKVDPSPDAPQESMGVTGKDVHGKTAADVTAAVQSANALDFVSEFSEGFETNAGQNGSSLSGGQKQRIAIARAIVRQPTFLLLDEATAALDNETERIVQASIDELLADGSSRTTLVIAHRLSTIRQADVICVVVDGRIREQGSHADLMDKQGLYFKLVKAGGRSSAMEEGEGAAAPAGAEDAAAIV